MSRPNVLLVMTDQHRRDCLSCMGHPAVRTPNLDALAAQGVRFTQAYTPSPICGPARGALFTGRFPPGCGAVTNWAPLHDDVTVLPELLGAAGYQTALAGKLHFVPAQAAFGFEYKQLNDLPGNTYADDGEYSDYVRHLAKGPYRHDPREPIRLFDEDERQIFGGDLKRFILGSNWADEPHHMTTWVADRSIDFLRKRDRRRPFFLFSSFFGPHQPYAVPPPWQGRHRPARVAPEPPGFEAMKGRPIFEAISRDLAERIHRELSEDDVRDCVAAYYDNVEMLDHHIGRVFDELRAQGDWDNTLVVMLSDHGEHLGQNGLFFKSDMYESAVGVPLLIKPPGRIQPAVCDRVVNTLGLYATIAEAAGCDPHADAGVECRSLTALCEDPHTAACDDHAFSIFGKDPQQNLTMLRRGRWKLIRQAQGDAPPLYELYDMGDAVPEQQDRWPDAQSRAEVQAMRAELDDWWARQGERYPETLVTLDKMADRSLTHWDET